MRYLLNLTLFFSWFISFAVVNFEDANWGLQLGWVFAFLFSLFYSFGSLLNARKLYACLYITPSRSVVFIFLTVLSLSAIAWISFASGITQLPDDSMLSRTLGHTGYLCFYFAVYVCVSSAINNDQGNYWVYCRWFFIYPFLFIGVWGLYQFICTYGILNYNDFFNNSLSTGFTYERFRESHRVSSVFPEPSEYSYYLALLGPIIWGAIRNKIPICKPTGLKIFIVIIWLSQAAMVKSLSFVIAVPFIIFFCLYSVEGMGRAKSFVFTLFLCVFALCVIAFSLFDRLAETVSGEDGSALVRYEGLLEALEVFWMSPIIGFGYGIIRGLDALSFLMASFGLVGVFILVCEFKTFLGKVAKYRTPIFSGAVYCMFSGCILSNNIFDHIFIWLLFAIISVPIINRSSLVEHNSGVNFYPSISGNDFRIKSRV